MKQQFIETKTGQSLRLRELIALRFQRQADAAKVLGCSQPDISRYCAKFNKHPLPAYFKRVYAPRLQDVGLNPMYLVDPRQPKLLPDAAAERAEVLKAELKQLQNQAANV